jgi:predicted TIM-barrel fold metal-dependent hydrolase
MVTFTRRAALSSIPTVGLGILAAPPASASNNLFDAHVHVWSADTDKYPLAPGFQKKDLWFPSFTPEELAVGAGAAAPSRVNLVQMTWYGLDHSYIADIIAKAPGRFVGTGIVPAVIDTSGPNPDKTMVELSKLGIFAFRVRGKTTRPELADGPQWMDHPGYEKMFAAAAENHLALSFLMSPPDIPEVERMCARFPEAPVIIDHLCLIGRKGTFAEDEIEALCRMARHKRVMLKVGAFYGLGGKKPPYLELLPLIRKVVTAFGPERCMWESDAPLQVKPPQAYDAAVALIRERADYLTHTDREQILFRTADDFFFKRRRV